jgi:formate-nitrite transporter family protein
MYLLGPVLEAPSWVILLSALFTGWLMGLLSWLLTAGRDGVSQIFFIWLITGVIAFGRLPHAISGAIELFVVLFSPGTERLANAGRVLAWTTMGNAAGGVLFAVLIWSSVLISGSGRKDGDDVRRGWRLPAGGVDFKAELSYPC